MQGAIFDMDGLLIDSEKLWQGVWHELAAERGIMLAETFPGDICGTGGAKTREVLRRYYPNDDPELVMRECSERVHRLEERGVPLKPGVRVILEGLRGEGYRIAVASSSPMDMILHNLRLDGVDGYFDVLASGREVANCKPAPDVFLLAAERLGLPPAECWVFEDSLIGVEAAWRAGCRAVMVPDMVRPGDETRRRCFGVCRDLAEAWEAVRGRASTGARAKEEPVWRSNASGAWSRLSDYWREIFHQYFSAPNVEKRPTIFVPNAYMNRIILFFCESCVEKHEHEFLLPITNSPRMGVCGYDGEQDEYAFLPFPFGGERP